MVDVDGREAEGLRGCAAAAVASHFTSGEQVLFYFRHFTSDVFYFFFGHFTSGNSQEMMLVLQAEALELPPTLVEEVKDWVSWRSVATEANPPDPAGRAFSIHNH